MNMQTVSTRLTLQHLRRACRWAFGPVHRAYLRHRISLANDDVREMTASLQTATFELEFYPAQIQKTRTKIACLQLQIISSELDSRVW